MEEKKYIQYSEDDEPLTKSNITVKEINSIDTQEETKRGRPKKSEDEKKTLKTRSEAQIASFEKARQVRQERIALQKKEKEEQLAKLYMESKQKESDKQKEVDKQIEVEKPKRHVKKQYVEDSSESEEEVIVVKRKPKQKKPPKKKIIYVESSDEPESEIENEPIVSVRRQTIEYEDPFSKFV